MENNQDRWDAAIKHAKEMFEVYKEIGPTGTFGAMMIASNIALYEDGDRSEALLESLENIK